MRFRWTMKQLEDMSTDEILRGIVSERMSDLEPYAPLSKRLGKIYQELEKKVIEERK